MTDIFLKLLNMSVAASWIVLAVVLLRLVLKKAPKWIFCLLWGIVALRLVMPFSPEIAISLIPSPEVFPEDILSTQTPAIYSGIPAVNSAINPMFSMHVTEGDHTLETILHWASVVWIAGVALMLLYSLVSWALLRRQVRVAVPCGKHVYLCDDISSPFVMGVLRPKIYITSGLDGEQLQHVLDHEYIHIRRKDHWWKPLGFLLLSIYWFNPLLWLGYGLLCRDIEQACDERVVAGMDTAKKQRYAKTLLACSVHRRMVMACPVAFGEVDVKTRIVSVLHYKKPTFWIILVSVLACTATAVCFLTNPLPCRHEYDSRITTATTCARKGIQTHTCTLCAHSYTTPITPLPHTYDLGTVAQAPTCTAQGIRKFACVDCGAEKKEAIGKLAHAYDNGTVVQPPTCTAAGSRKLTCTGCGAVKREKIDPVAHTAGAPTFLKEPNCTEKGERSATCTVCHKVFTLEILETNQVHDLKETVQRQPTCSQQGEGIRTCTRCDHSETCTYEKLSHHYTQTDTWYWYCTNEGTTSWTCTDCGNIYTTSAPPIEHVKEDTYFYSYCIRCGKILHINSTGNGADLQESLFGNKKDSSDDMFPVIRWDVLP